MCKSIVLNIPKLFTYSLNKAYPDNIELFSVKGIKKKKRKKFLKAGGLYVTFLSIREITK